MFLKWLLGLSGIDELLTELWDATWLRISKWILAQCENLIYKSTSSADGFWNEAIINQFLDFSRWISMGIVAAATVLMIFDVVEDAARQRQIDYTVIFGNFFKGLAFAIIAPYAGKYILTITSTLAGSLQLSSVSEIVKGIPKTNPVAGYLYVAAASVFFYIMSLARFGTMFVQSLTPCLYVSDIVRGETAAMGSWIRQTVAISLTHLIQTSLYYLGVYFMLHSNITLCLACWIGMTQTKKVLDKYGMSSGVTGIVSSAGQVVSTGISLVSKIT